MSSKRCFCYFDDTVNFLKRNRAAYISEGEICVVPFGTERTGGATGTGAFIGSTDYIGCINLDNIKFGVKIFLQSQSSSRFSLLDYLYTYTHFIISELKTCVNTFQRTMVLTTIF